MKLINFKGIWRWCIALERFMLLDFVQRVFSKTRFENWTFPSSGKIKVTSTLLGPLKRASLTTLLGPLEKASLTTLLGPLKKASLTTLLGPLERASLTTLLGPLERASLTTLLGPLERASLTTLLGPLERASLTTLLGPLERASLNQWTETAPVSETLCFLRKQWTMDKIQKHDSFKYIMKLPIINFLQPHVTFSLISTYILLSPLLSKSVDVMIFTSLGSYKTGTNYNIVCFNIYGFKRKEDARENRSESQK
jgi:hypothetical protein